MNKLTSLRTALLALPALAGSPERLSLFAERGKLVATGQPGNGWEYRYTATAIVQDFAGDMDELSATLIDWIAINQPDLLQDASRRDDAVRFEVEVMTSEAVDVSIEVDLTEPVRRDGNGSAIHLDPPPADPTAAWLWPS